MTSVVIKFGCRNAWTLVVTTGVSSTTFNSTWAESSEFSACKWSIKLLSGSSKRRLISVTAWYADSRVNSRCGYWKSKIDWIAGSIGWLIASRKIDWSSLATSFSKVWLRKAATAPLLHSSTSKFNAFSRIACGIRSALKYFFQSVNWFAARCCVTCCWSSSVIQVVWSARFGIRPSAIPIQSIKLPLLNRWFSGKRTASLSVWLQAVAHFSISAYVPTK